MTQGMDSINLIHLILMAMKIELQKIYYWFSYVCRCIYAATEDLMFQI